MYIHGHALTELGNDINDHMHIKPFKYNERIYVCTFAAFACREDVRWSSKVMITGYLLLTKAWSFKARIHSLKSTGGVKVLIHKIGNHIKAWIMIR